MKPLIPKELRDKTRSNMVVVAFGLALYGVLLFFGQIAGFLNTLFGILSPFFIGIALAFLLNAPLRKLETMFQRAFRSGKPHPKLCRALGVICCYVVLLGGVIAFFLLLVPQLVQSIRSIYLFVRSFLSVNNQKINEFLMNFNFLSYEGENPVVLWENVVNQTGAYVRVVAENAVQLAGSISSIVYQLFIGLIASIYLLLEKDTLSIQAKKLCYALLPRQSCETLIYWARRGNHICSDFLAGKLIDSLIIGVLCYIGMGIFHIEYQLLISVIIGVTNILPFFGPLIGAVPSILILLIINPYSALWFTIFVLALQQIDGNILGPYILGDSVGISPLWIMFSIIVGSGLFGFMGMLLSVPVFALIYAILSTVTDGQLRRRGLRTRAEAYAAAPEQSPEGSDPTTEVEAAPRKGLMHFFSKTLTGKEKKKP